MCVWRGGAGGERSPSSRPADSVSSEAPSWFIECASSFNLTWGEGPGLSLGLHL